MRPIDAEIAACVRARQHTLLRSAYLVCGDAHTAEDLVQVALEKLALRWDTTRHERPDAFVRMILYRNAAPCGARRDAATEVAQDSVLDGPMHSALAQTAPRSNGPTAARGGGRRSPGPHSSPGAIRSVSRAPAPAGTMSPAGSPQGAFSARPPTWASRPTAPTKLSWPCGPRSCPSSTPPRCGPSSSGRTHPGPRGAAASWASMAGWEVSRCSMSASPPAAPTCWRGTSSPARSRG
jgi:hypothetical protein